MVFSQAWLCREQVSIFFRLFPKILVSVPLNLFYFWFNSFSHSKNAENSNFKVKAFAIFVHHDSRNGCALVSVMSCLITLESWIWTELPEPEVVAAHRESQYHNLSANSACGWSNGSAPAHIWTEGWSEKLVKAWVYILRYIINRRLFITV